MGTNRKWALETKAKGHPKYCVTCTKIEERGKTSWEKPPLKIQCNQKKRQSLSNGVLDSKTITQRAKLLLSECLGEDVCNLFC